MTRTKQYRRNCSGHRAEKTVTKCFSGPIYGAEENQAAHGNIRLEEICRCGARRHSNVNGCHIEEGDWDQGTRGEASISRAESVAACPGHWAVVIRGLDENQTAHRLGWRQEEICICGARRYSIVSRWESERGNWH